jgi:choline kinase
MNIIIPAGGAGSRFSEYSPLPKPLIDIGGEPMVIKSVKSLDIKGNYYFLIRENEYTDRLSDAILKYMPSAYIMIIDYKTEGAACSGLLFEEFINNPDELIIANCDQIMDWDSARGLEELREYDAGVVTVPGDSPKHSYARIEDNRVVEIKEKVVISNNALVGIHYWKQGKYFVDSAKDMISASDRFNNEFYIAPSFNYLIKKNINVGIHHLPKEAFWPVGIPEDLEKYLKHELLSTQN